MVLVSQEAKAESEIGKGFVAEWLGRGLQNLLQRFESARNLRIKSLLNFRRLFALYTLNKLCMLEITRVSANETLALEQVKALLREYVNWLNLDLSFQGFEEELASLPAPYEAPEGVLFLAKVDGQPAGCVAVRSFDNTTAEMKRLFVRDAYKHHGVGKALATAAITAATELGYKRMLLDTLAHMRPAIDLYTGLGFQPIAAYYDNPISNAVYLSLMLDKAG
jgi:GNAT superfamily N-acetyltransferase